MARLALGRRKIPIVKMQKNSNRQVTFSKRRNGLIKKASELCTLTGTELVVVVFSPGGKPYSFGHPSAKSVIDKFLNEANEQQSAVEEGLIRAQQAMNERELNFTLKQTKGLVEKEKRSVEQIDQERKRTEGTVWWEKPMEELHEEQLALLIEKMRKVINEADQEEALMLEQASGLNGHGLPNFMGTDSIGGQISDPRGKGPATSLTSYGFASSLPTEGVSSSLYKEFVNQPPLCPQMQGYSAPFNPMGVGSSSGEQQDPGAFGFCHQGQAFDSNMGSGSNVDITLDQMMMGPSCGGNGGEIFDLRGKGPATSLPSYGLANSLPALHPQLHGYSVPFDPLGVGSSSGAPQDPGAFGFFHQGQTFDPNMGSGSSVNMTLDQMIMGPSSIGNDGEIFDPRGKGPTTSSLPSYGLPNSLPQLHPQMHGYSAPFNPIEVGSSSGAPQDPSAFGFYHQGQTFDPNMGGGSSVNMTLDQVMMGPSSSGNGMLFNPDPTGFQGSTQSDSNTPWPSDEALSYSPIKLI